MLKPDYLIIESRFGLELSLFAKKTNISESFTESNSIFFFIGIELKLFIISLVYYILPTS